jgi:subtilisin family serine protease
MLCGAAALFFVVVMPVNLHAQALAGRVGPNGKSFRDGRILIIPKAGRDAALVQRHGGERTRVRQHHRELGNVQVIELPPGADAANVLARYRASGDVVAAELDRWYFPAIEPNDPSYFDGTQWQLNNTGQNGGTSDADIDAPEAWDTLNSASNVIVAVVDTGVRVTHEDLAANIWTNAAGQRGFNAINPGADPLEDFLHGTHVAGIIGAVGNNGVGVSGLAWKVKIMPCKFIDATSGSESDLFECLTFAKTNGAKVVNCSFVAPGPYSVALSNAFLSLRDAGIIVVAAAGNNWTDNDVTPYYPGAFALDNVVCVTATTRNDGQAYNFGANTVHLGAPGVDIYSTWGSSDTAYVNNSGTSMATPMVSGAMALLRARFPYATHQELIARLLATVDPLPSLVGRCTSGGRLNLARALGPSLLADFIPSRASGPAPMSVTFNNTSWGSITNYSWQFGDGSPLSSATNPSHTFTNNGTYSVTLTVTDTNGVTATTNRLISVTQYLVQSAPFDWVPTNGLNPLTLSNDGVSPAQALPFAFSYYGQNYSQLYVGANGLIGFVNTDLSNSANADLPSSVTPNAAIYPYWDNLNPVAGGSISFGVIGEAPNRRAVAIWNAVPHNTTMGGATPITAQVILHEGGAIAFQYLQVEQGNATRVMGKSATIGVEDASGNLATKYTYNGSPAIVTNGQALVFTTTGHVPPIPSLSVIPATAGQFVIRIAAEPGRFCVIHSSTNLPVWNALVTNLVPASGVMFHTNSAPSASSKRFYRVGLQ